MVVTCKSRNRELILEEAILSKFMTNHIYILNIGFEASLTQCASSRSFLYYAAVGSDMRIRFLSNIFHVVISIKSHCTTNLRIEHLSGSLIFPILN